jgi:hypothetical protein
VAWGGLHGLYLVINHGWRRLLQVDTRERSPPSMPATVLSSALTMLAVIVAWVFFRAEDMGSASTMLSAMAGVSPEASVLAEVPGAQWAGLACTLLVARLLPNSQEIVDGRIAPWFGKLAAGGWRPVLGFPVGIGIVAVVFAAMISASRSVTEFIYFNF